MSEISVVLCSYNNAQRLRITLQSFCCLERPERIDWELVVVNNNSTDNTEAVIKSFEDQLPIVYVYEPEQGLSHAQNAGLEVARGELIVFTDDDVEPNSNWIQAYWRAYQEHPHQYYFGGPVVSKFGGEVPDDDFLRVAMPSVAGLDYGPHARELSKDEFFIGPNWACPAKFLKRVGKFDPELGLNSATQGTSTGEETDLMKRLEDIGGSGWYIPDAKVKHFVPSKKCTLEHVVGRYTSQIDSAYTGESEMPKTLFGLPLGLYKAAVLSWGRWIGRRASGMMWKKEYVEWRAAAKLVKAYHNRSE
jgi:glycosyltransferase involved in cell wall biosynthesis